MRALRTVSEEFTTSSSASVGRGLAKPNVRHHWAADRKASIFAECLLPCLVCDHSFFSQGASCCCCLLTAFCDKGRCGYYHQLQLCADEPTVAGVMYYCLNPRPCRYQRSSKDVGGTGCMGGPFAPESCLRRAERCSLRAVLREAWE